MAFKDKKQKSAPKLNRKQQRKEKRKEKKVKRNQFFSKKKIPLVLNPDRIKTLQEVKTVTKTSNKKINNKKLEDVPKSHNKELTTEEVRKKEMKEHKKLQSEMKKQRSKQLLEANKEEDVIIRQMEKQLGLKKRKTKSIPKSFSEDGLDFLLEVVDPEYLKNVSDKGLDVADDDFEADFAIMTGRKVDKVPKKHSNKDNVEDDHKSDVDEESEDLSNEDMEFDEEVDDFDEEPSSFEEEEDLDNNEEDDDDVDEEDDDDMNNSDDDMDSSDELENKIHKKKDKLEKPNKRKNENINQEKNKKQKIIQDSDDNEDNIEDESDDNIIENERTQKGAAKYFPDGTWEDIYGRLRGKDGSVINKDQSASKYIPPALREKMISASEDKKRLEKLNRLRKQLKGLLNRLAESNMHSITSQIEELYMNNSRNDMNDTLTNLIMDSVVSEVLTPERLLIEHIVLITILHANVGTEVGAHFLQHVIRKFDEYFDLNQEVENKTLDNIICILAQLYNFKLFDSKLLYEILQKLTDSFKEKDVECILHILRSVGFSLRKDNPLELKKLIIDLQNKAGNASDQEKDNSRIKFMLDILLAIKNNNVTKIPNYDVSYSEHLKKVMKGFIRKGNYVTELNISLQDLLNADERGKWWVVGSAWTGNEIQNNEKSENIEKTQNFSTKLLELAKKQRMNTDVRRNIFCIIMSAEDYLDAFEKLLKLGLKNQQEREIINVILHCCLQEKVFNPYYGHLAQKLCDYDRKYQLTIKYSVWDKLKTIQDHSGPQLANLAKLLIHLFIEKGLPISILKVVQFSELDKINLRFMRQILLGILLHQDLEVCLSVFARVAQSDKLKLFRESLRLFIHHFVLRNLKADKIPEEEKNLIENRAKMVEKVLTTKQVKV